MRYLLSLLNYFLEWVSSSMKSINHYMTSHGDCYNLPKDKYQCLEFYNTHGRMVDRTVRKSYFYLDDENGNIKEKNHHALRLSTGSPPNEKKSGIDKFVYSREKRSNLEKDDEKYEKFEIEILKKDEFKVNEFLSFYEKRRALEESQVVYLSDPMDLQIFSDYFSFFSKKANTKCLGKDCKIGKIRDLDGKDWPKQVNGVEIPQYYQDVPADGACGYYSLICSIFNCRDAKKILSENFFDISEIKKYYGIDDPIFEYLDFYRIMAFISLNNVDAFEELSCYQLYDITFYLKILIYLELKLKKIPSLLQSYKDHEDRVNEEVANILTSHSRWIPMEFGFPILSKLLNIEIIGLSYCKGSNINKILENETADLQGNKSVVFVCTNNSHFCALRFQE